MSLASESSQHRPPVEMTDSKSGFHGSWILLATRHETSAHISLLHCFCVWFRKIWLTGVEVLHSTPGPASAKQENYWAPVHHKNKTEEVTMMDQHVVQQIGPLR